MHESVGSIWRDALIAFFSTFLERGRKCLQNKAFKYPETRVLDEFLIDDDRNASVG